MEVTDDKIGIVDVDIEGNRSQHNPGQTTDEEGRQETDPK
jgi:hypothetical protein